MLRVLLGLVVVAGALAAADNVTSISSAEAKPQKCDGERNAPGCGGGGGGGGGATACRIDFDAVFDDADGDGVLSDGWGLYQDGVDRMAIGTGSGPGFRFDTNGGSQKLEGAGGVRRLELIVPAFGDLDEPLLSGIDLRFHLGDGGLDLCGLATVDDTGQVGLNILFEDEGGTKWTVNYSDGCISPNLDTRFISSPVDVTRISADSWTIEGGFACVVEYDEFDDVEVYGGQWMPFSMTITAQ